MKRCVIKMELDYNTFPTFIFSVVGSTKSKSSIYQWIRKQLTLLPRHRHHHHHHHHRRRRHHPHRRKLQIA